MRELLETDRRLYLRLHSRWRAGWLDPVMVWFTRAGTKGVLWLGLAAGLFLDGSPPARATAAASVAALLLAEGVVNVGLKPAIRRERPFARAGLGALLVQAPGPNSWPSAHAASSVAAAGVLSYAYPVAAPAFLVAALLIAYSRIYVGVHYPLDVLAGVVIGCVCAVVVILGSHLVTPAFYTQF